MAGARIRWRRKIRCPRARCPFALDPFMGRDDAVSEPVHDTLAPQPESL